MGLRDRIAERVGIKADRAPLWKSWREKAFFFDMIVGAVQICAWVHHAFPTAILIAMISIIGLPLAVLFMFAALIAGPMLLGQVIYWTWGWLFPRRKTVLPWFGSMACGFALSALLAVAMNAPGRQAARDWIAQDRMGPVAPVARGAVLGYVASAASCDLTCQRLLLSGQAGAVIIAVTSWKSPPEDPLSLPATRWSLERREAACPEVKLGGGEGPLGGAFARGQSPADAMRLRNLAGDCLLSVPATLGQADTVWTMLSLQHVSPYGFKRGAEALSVNRFQLWQRQDGALAEVWRDTAVTAQEVFPWPVDWWHFGGIEHPTAGYLRRAVHWNPAPRAGRAPFLIERLGLDLDLRDADTSPQAIVAQIGAVLDLPGDLSPAALALIKSFEQDFSVRSEIAPQDWPFFLRLFSDPRLKPDSNIGFALSRAANARPELWPELAEVAFTRLGGTKEERRGATSALREAPLEVLAPHRALLFALARDPVRRVETGRLLQRLRDFGPEGQSLLLWMIDDAGRFSGESWQAPYLAGMIGLCEAGPAAQAFAPEILARVQAGQIWLNGSYRDLALSTLLQLGVPPEDFRVSFETGKNAITPKLFEQSVKRFRQRPDCGF